MSRPFNPEYIDSTDYDNLEAVEGVSHPVFDDYSVDELYQAGILEAAYLFDNLTEDPDNTPYIIRPRVMNENDSAFSRKLKRLSPEVSFLTEEVWQEKLGHVRTGIENYRLLERSKIGFSPVEERNLRRSVREGDIAQTEIFYSLMRFGDWFVRESMGLHTATNQEKGRKPARSRFVQDKKLEDYASENLDYSDRLQVVLVAIWSAIPRTAESENTFSLAQFKSYASFAMEQAIRREIDNSSHDYIARIPIHRKDQLRKLGKIVADSEEIGQQVSADDASYELSLPKRQTLRSDAGKKQFTVEELAEKMVQLSSISLEYLERDIARFDYESIDEDPIRLSDRIAQSDSGAYNVILNSISLEDFIKRIRQSLDARDYQILAARCGLNGDSPQTLAEVGEQWNLTRERVRQLEARALSTLRHSDNRLRDISMAIGSDFDESTYPVEEVLRLSTEEVGKLGLENQIVFDRTPSIKYRVRNPKKKFIYQEDWTDDGLSS